MELSQFGNKVKGHEIARKSDQNYKNLTPFILEYYAIMYVEVLAEEEMQLYILHACHSLYLRVQEGYGCDQGGKILCFSSHSLSQVLKRQS
jgi:hypothetical protein